MDQTVLEMLCKQNFSSMTRRNNLVLFCYQLKKGYKSDWPIDSVGMCDCFSQLIDFTKLLRMVDELMTFLALS
jgi:hypothetical protein